VSERKWSAVPAARSSAPLLQVKLWLVLGLLAVLVIMGPLAMVIALTNKAPAPATPPAVPPGPTYTSALAQVAAVEYLTGIPYTIPLATGIDPNHGAANNSAGNPISLGATGLVFAGNVTNQIGGVSFQIDHFLFTQNSNLYHLDVTMINTPSGGVLGAQPALFPADNAPSNSTPPLNYAQSPNAVSPPANLQTQVNTWATAYATDNSTELAQLANHPGNYIGLGGYSVVGTPQIISTITYGSDYIVRVSVLLSSLSAQGYQAQTEFDLLVYPGSGLPLIVAWGPPGALPLIPYSNQAA